MDPQSSARGGWSDFWAIVFVAAVPLAIFWDATLGLVLLAPGDAIVMALPNRQLVAETLRSGQLPLWNPFMFSGFPMLAASHMSVFHPGTWMLLVLPVLWAMNLQMLATYAVAGVGTYAYCRSIGADPFGAVIGALTFAGSGFMIGHMGHVHVIQAAALLPVVLWCLERLRSETTVRFIAGGAAAVAFAIFAGHPQVPVVILFTASAYGVYFAAFGRNAVERGRYLVSVAVTLAFGLLLAAAQLVPMPELVSQSVRSRMTFEEFTSFALPVNQLPTLLMPYVFGGARGTIYRGAWNLFELIGYAGIVAPMFALAALPWAIRDRVARFWLLVGGVALLLALGSATPLARIAYEVPVWNLFRGAARNLLLADLALAVLAAWGATHALSRSPRSVAVGALIVTAIVLVCASVAMVELPTTLLDPGLALPLALAVASTAALILLSRRPTVSRRFAVIGLLVLDLFSFARMMDHTFLDRATMSQRPDFATALLPRNVEPSSARIVPANAGDYRAARLDFAAWRLSSIAGYEPLMLTRYGAFAGDMNYYGTIADTTIVQRSTFLDLLNVEYLVIETPEASASPDDSPRFTRQPLDAALDASSSLVFTLQQAVPSTSVDLVTFLSGSQSVPDGAVVGRVRAVGDDGRTVESTLRAGVDTAEWAHERPDVKASILHGAVEPFEPMDGAGFRGSRYLTRLPLPEGMRVIELQIEGSSPWGYLHVARISLHDDASSTSTPITHLHAIMRGDARWEPIFKGERTVVLRNRNALPRSWLVPATEVLPPEKILESVRTGRLPDGRPYDPRAVALIEEGTASNEGELDPSASARVTAWEANEVEVETRSAKPAFLVLSEIFYPGWRATVDDRPVPILRTNYVLRGVQVPAGTHRVRFEFRPPLVLLGAVVSALTLLLMIGCAAWFRRWNKRFETASAA